MAKTREEFESAYNGGVIMPLVKGGRLSIECHCTEDMCEGWKMTHVDWLKDDVELYGNTNDEISTALMHRLMLLSADAIHEGKKID